MKAGQGDELTYAEKFQLNPIDFEDIPIERDVCQFSLRTWKRLSASGILTAGDLLRAKESELRKISGFGQKCAEEVTVFLQMLTEKQIESEMPPVEILCPTETLKSYREDIYNGEFSFAEGLELTNTERAYLAAVQDGFALIDYDLILQAKSGSRQLLLIQQMLKNAAEAQGGRRQLAKAVEKIPEDRLHTSVSGYINTFSENESTRRILRGIYGAEDVPLGEVLAKLSLTKQELKLAVKFAEWCAFDIDDELRQLFERIYKKENMKIVLRERSNNSTLEAAGQVFGVTRERARQIEKDARRSFSKWYSRTKILSQISAVRDGDHILTAVELQEYFGQHTSVILYLLRTTENLPYLYDSELDAFIVEDFDQSERVQNFMEEMPDSFNISKLDSIREDAAEKGLSVELLTLSINNAYRLTGNVYHRSRLSLQELCRQILERHYRSGMRVYDGQQLADFRRYVKEDFGDDVDLPKRDRTLASDIRRVSILCGRGMYKLYENEGISNELLDAICSYIDESEKNIFLTNTLFSVFEEELLAEGIDNKYYLQGLMHRQLGDRYVFRRDYVSKDDSSTSIYMGIVNYIRQFDYPVSRKQIFDEYPGVTEIVFCLAVDDPKIINFFGEYIHADKLNFQKDDTEYFKSVLERMMSGNGYCNVRDVYACIKAENPTSMERLYVMYQSGLFSILEYLFREEYQFSRPYIAYPDVEISHASERMDELIRNAGEITLAEINEYAREIHFGINSILDFADEHNDTHFLKNDKELIPIEETAIDETCAAQMEALILEEIEGTTPISELGSIDQFPRVSVPWTEWLIYSVIRKWSDKLEVGTESSISARKFRHMHPTVSVKRDLHRN